MKQAAICGLLLILPLQAALADAGAGKPSPAPKSGDGLVYNAGGCPTGSLRKYPDGGAGPGSDCGAWDIDEASIAYVHTMPQHNLHWVCPPFASCDAGGASRAMQIGP